MLGTQVRACSSVSLLKVFSRNCLTKQEKLGDDVQYEWWLLNAGMQ